MISRENKSRIYILVGVILILTAVYFNNKMNIDMQLDQGSKSAISTVVSSCKGEMPNLQTDSAMAEWTEQAAVDQTTLMDSVLDNLTVIKKCFSGKPQKYISATYNNMSLYIPYAGINPSKGIVIKTGGNYYFAEGTESSIQKVINYMISQQIIK